MPNPAWKIRRWGGPDAPWYHRRSRCGGRVPVHPHRSRSRLNLPADRGTTEEATMNVFDDKGSVVVHHGDCLDVMTTMADGSVDAVVTDPPYDLTTGKKGGTGGGFMGKRWDGTGVAFDPATWVECLRVLKPGGYLLAFGGSRTYHRLTCAIEDAGFEIRDSIAWLYGSGFPKSLDVSKAIDKAAGAEREVVGKHASPAGNHAGGAALNMSVVGMPRTVALTAPATDDAKRWQGFGTALKPAFEPIVVARKPIRGTVAANVLEHGTGALNIDGCRTALNGDYKSRANGRPSLTGLGDNYASAQANVADVIGRWPTNVVLDGSQADELDRQSGRSSSRSGGMTTKALGVMNDDAWVPKDLPRTGHDDSGGASRFFPVFRYQAKAPGKERPKVDGVAHPTVKPLALMRWLVRLVTPPGGVVLDPFAGSGTTAEAAVAEGMRCILIESEPTYLPLIDARLKGPR